MTKHGYNTGFTVLDGDQVGLMLDYIMSMPSSKLTEQKQRSLIEDTLRAVQTGLRAGVVTADNIFPLYDDYATKQLAQKFRYTSNVKDLLLRLLLDLHTANITSREDYNRFSAERIKDSQLSDDVAAADLTRGLLDNLITVLSNNIPGFSVAEHLATTNITLINPAGRYGVHCDVLLKVPGPTFTYMAIRLKVGMDNSDFNYSQDFSTKLLMEGVRRASHFGIFSMGVSKYKLTSKLEGLTKIMHPITPVVISISPNNAIFVPFGASDTHYKLLEHHLITKLAQYKLGGVEIDEDVFRLNDTVAVDRSFSPEHTTVSPPSTSTPVKVGAEITASCISPERAVAHVSHTNGAPTINQVGEVTEPTL